MKQRKMRTERDEEEKTKMEKMRHVLAQYFLNSADPTNGPKG